MRVGFLQFQPRHQDVGANLAHIERLLARVEADLLVLPELCTSGYMFRDRAELGRFAELVPAGPSCRAIGRICRERSVNVVFGMAESLGEHIFNSAVLATASGDFHVYHKAHLFLEEKDIFDPGDMPFPVFEVAGVKLGMLVCFDHYFPEAARSLALAGAQVICHPSNLVLDSAQKTTVARAIENRVYWILANRIGSETRHGKTLHFTGHSQIVGPTGSLLARAGEETEELQVVEIDPAAALDKHATPKNDLFADRRVDLYRL